MDVARPTPSTESQSRHAHAELRFAFPSTDSSVVSVIDMVKRAMQLLKLEDEWIFRVELSLQEALLNGHLHGNQADPDKDLRVVCTLAPSKVEIRVEDDGPGFDHGRDISVFDLKAPNGKGLSLIHQLMDAVTINGNRSHIVMSLVKE